MSDNERQFWREVHKALDALCRAIVKHKLSTRKSDENAKKEAA